MDQVRPQWAYLIPAWSRHPFFFFSFMREFRAQPDQAGKPIAETAKAGSEAWRSLTEEEKDVSFPLT